MSNLLWLKVKDSETLKKIISNDFNLILKNSKIESFGFQIKDKEIISKFNNENFTDDRSFWIKSESLESNLSFASLLAKKINISILSFDGQNFYLFNAFGNKMDINHINNLNGLFYSLFDYLNSNNGEIDLVDFQKFIGENLFSKYNEIFLNLKLEFLNYIHDLNKFFYKNNFNSKNINFLELPKNILETKHLNEDEDFMNNIDNLILQKQFYFNKFKDNKTNDFKKKVNIVSLKSNEVIDLLSNKQKNILDLKSLKCNNLNNDLIWTNNSKELTKEIIDKKIGDNIVAENKNIEIKNSDYQGNGKICINDFMNNFLNSVEKKSEDYNQKNLSKILNKKINCDENPALCLHLTNIVKEKQDLFKNFNRISLPLSNINLNISLIILQDVTMDEYNEYLKIKHLLWSDSYKYNLLLSSKKDNIEKIFIKPIESNVFINLIDNIKEPVSSEKFLIENKVNYRGSFKNNFSNKQNWFDEKEKTCEKESCLCIKPETCCSEELGCCSESLNWFDGKDDCCSGEYICSKPNVKFVDSDIIDSLSQKIDSEISNLYEDFDDLCVCSDDNLICKKNDKSIFDFIDLDNKEKGFIKNISSSNKLDEDKINMDELINLSTKEKLCLEKQQKSFISNKNIDENIEAKKKLNLLENNDNNFSFDNNKKIDLLNNFSLSNKNNAPHKGTTIEKKDLVFNFYEKPIFEIKKEDLKMKNIAPNFEDLINKDFVDSSPSQITFNPKIIDDQKYQEIKFTSDNNYIEDLDTNKSSWVELKSIDSKYSSSLNNESCSKPAKECSQEPACEVKKEPLSFSKNENFSKPIIFENSFKDNSDLKNKYVEVSFISKPIINELPNNVYDESNINEKIYSSSLSNEYSKISEKKPVPTIDKTEINLIDLPMFEPKNVKINMPKLIPDTYPEVYDKKIIVSTNFKNLDLGKNNDELNEIPFNLSELIKEDEENRLNLSREIENFINELREEKRKLQEKKIAIQQNLLN